MTTADLDTLRSQLVLHEGNKALAYDDATGNPLKRGDTLKGFLTVGVGRNLTTKPLSARIRALMLDEDIEECLSDLRSFSWFFALDAVRTRALIDLRFNLGGGGLRGFVRFLAAMARKDYEAAADALLDSRWATQVQPSRRDRIVHQIRTGTDV